MRHALIVFVVVAWLAIFVGLSVIVYIAIANSNAGDAAAKRLPLRRHSSALNGSLACDCRDARAKAGEL